MAQNTNNSDDLTSLTNSTMTICLPCLNILTNSYTTIFIANFVISLPVSGRVLWLMMPSPSFLTEKTDVLTFNLQVNDFLFHLLTLPLIPGLYLYHHAAQYAWSFVFNIMVIGRPLFQCCICVERYLAVKHPFTFLRYRPLRYRAAILAMAWMAVILLSSMTASLCGTPEDWSIVIAPFQCTMLFLIFVVNSFCSLSIIKALIRPSPGDEGRERGRADVEGKESEKEAQRHHMKKRAFTTILMFQILMVICYVPPIALAPLYKSLERRVFCIYSTAGVCLIMLSSFSYSFSKLIRMSEFTWPCFAKKG